MRNLHNILEKEFGRESVAIFRDWEHHVKKLANFKNHRRFTLRCISQKITPVSLKLKRNITTKRGREIIDKAEKQLLEERVRQINNTIDICSHLTYTCIKELKGKIPPELFEECQVFIDKVREWRHKTVLDRHLVKFERLCQKTKGGRSKQHPGGHSNLSSTKALNKDREVRILPAVTSNRTTTTTTTTRDTAEDASEKKWVINLSSSPLTQAQASLLAHGPGYAVTPKHPPYGDYIVAIEKSL